MPVGHSELDRGASRANRVGDLHHFVERKARLDFFVRFTIHEDSDSLLAIEVLVLLQVNLRPVVRNEAILVGTTGTVSGESVRASRLAVDAVARDLAGIGFAGRDPWVDTRVIDLARIDDPGDAGPAAAILRDAWPMPEYAPLAGADALDSPLDAWLDRIGRRSSATPGTSAAFLATVLGSFSRVESGRAVAGDRELVVRALRSLLARDPDDGYVQHMFGFGPLLEARLERLRGVLEASERAGVDERMAAQRARYGGH